MTPERVDVSRLVRLRKAAADDPDSARAHMKLGTALIGTASIAEAESELRRALELEPDYAEALVNLGGIMLSRFDFEGCVEANRKAVSCRPDMFQAHYNQGLGHLYLAQADEMVECFAKAVGLDPESPGGNYHLAVGLFARGEVDKARARLNKALKLGYSPQPEFVRAISRENRAKPYKEELQWRTSKLATRPMRSTRTDSCRSRIAGTRP